MNLLFIIEACGVILCFIFLFRKKKKKEPKDLYFLIVTNRGSLNVYAPNAVDDLDILARVVSPNGRPVTEASLAKFFKRAGVLAIACDDTRIVGMASTIECVKLNGASGSLEQVATLPAYGGHGIARKLVGMLIVHTRIMGESDRIDLTCSPKRKVANRLYEKLGFEKRKTNCRRLSLKAT